MVTKKKIVISFVAVALLLAAVPYWLLATQPGLRFVLDRVFGMLELPITYKNVHGSVLTRIKADYVQYHNDAVTIDIEQFQTGFDLLPLLASTVNFDDVSAGRIDVRLHAQTADSTQDTQPADSASASGGLPVTIAIDQLAVDQLNVYSGEAAPLEFSKIKIQSGDIQRGLDFEDWEIASPWADIKVSGFLAFNNIDNNDLAVYWSSHAINEIPAMQGFSQIKGTYANLQVQVNTSAPAEIKIDATVNELFHMPQWSATVTSRHLPLSILVPDANTTVSDLRLDTQGNAQRYWIDAASKISDIKYGEWTTELSGQVAGQEVDIKRLLLTSAKSSARMSAAGSIKISAEDFRHYPLNLVLSWKDMQWPPRGDAVLEKSSGRLSVTGALADYQFQLDDAALLVAEQYITALTASGRGNFDSINVSQLKANYLHGMWQGNAGVDWSGPVKMKAALSAENVDPSTNWEKWPGRLSTRFTVNGRFQESDWHLDGKIDRLSGVLSGYKISKAALDYDISDNNYKLTNVVFYSDNNNITGNFNLSRPDPAKSFLVDASWNADIMDLAQLVPDAKGSIKSRGKFAGAIETPDIKIAVSGNELHYKNFQLASLEATMLAGLAVDGNLNVDLSMANGRYENSEISKATLKVNGTTFKHDIVLDSRFRDGQVLGISATGGYRDEIWSGQLTSTSLDLTKYGKWQLQKPSDIVFAADQTKITALCLVEQTHVSVACTELMLSAATTWAGKTTLENFAVENLNAWMPPYIKTVDGNINGRIDYDIVAGDIKNLQGRLSSTTGQFVYDLPAREKQVQQYRDFVLSANHTDSGVALATAINLLEAGQIKSRIDLLGLHRVQKLDFEQPIGGDLLIEFNSLIILPAIFPELQYAEGHKITRFKISGKLNDPLITGSSHLEAKTISIPAYGLKLTDVDLKVTSDNQRKLSINGQAKSGDGIVKISGELADYRAEKRTGQLTIKGENFRAAQIPEITVDVSPDLVFRLDGNALDMQGVIVVPRADIKVLDSTSSIRVSSDVVMIDESAQVEKASAFTLNASTRIKLGERVSIQGYGASGKLQGEILVMERPGEPTIATGELRLLDGKYNAYGTELKISKGDIIYASVPIMDPAIDIEARREIDDKIWAGVTVTGKASNPQIELASEPPMDNSDILSYIILGRPINQASRQDGSALTSAAASLGLVGGESLVKELADEFGIDEVSVQSDQTTQQTSMVLGKYLSPRLYAKYAIGLGQAVDTLQLEYKITSRWILRTEAGSEGQGADFLYRIETD